MSLTIYKASAGSGKTYTLAATYIRQLIAANCDNSHKHQLAVTFTNKATAEMKERILQYLYAIAMGNDDSDSFFQTLREELPDNITNSMIRSSARRSLFQIIHDYDHFNVTTIDSFFQTLLSAMAHELNLSATFKVEISDKEVLSKAVDRLLLKLDRNSDEFKWVTKYIRGRIGDDKTWDVADELKLLAKEITRESYMLHSHLLNKKTGHEPGAINLTNELVKAYEESIQKLAHDLRESTAKCARRAHEFIEKTIGGYANISNGSRIVNPPVTKIADESIPLDKINVSATFRSYASGAKEVFTGKKLKEIHGLDQYADDLRSYLQDIVEHYDDSLPMLNSCLLSLQNLNPLRLLAAINREVDDLNHENDRMLLAYTPLLFHKLASGADSSFVFERAGTRYDHVMIDEFQDTSKLQWANMKKLLLEDLSQGNSCMLVGDVKQGIYRFRGGDWNALAGFDKGENEELHTYINIKTLDTNYRSGEVVVDFNNRFFLHAATVINEAITDTWGDEPAYKANHDQAPRDGKASTIDMERIYPQPGETDTHEVTQIPHHEGGFVRVELVEKKAKQAEGSNEGSEGEGTSEGDGSGTNDYAREAGVAEQMVMLHEAGVPYNDMAILVRSNRDSKRLLSYFEQHHGQGTEHHIALMSEEAFLLSSSPAVMTIINALRYVHNPKNTIALQYAKARCLDLEHWDEIQALLEEWHESSFSGLPFYEVSCRLASMFRLHDLDGQSPYIYFYLDAVLDFMDDHSPSLPEFLEYWDDTLSGKSIPSAAVNGVRILTIHKSKGLAFHSVFIPYCDWNIEQQASLIWTRPPEKPFNAIPLLPVVMDKKAGQSIYREVYKQEIFDTYVENLNLLYVAFTRTQQNLLVWADRKKGIGKIVAKTLEPMEGDVAEWGERSALRCSKPAQEAHPAEQPLGAPKSDNPLTYDPTPIYIDFEHHEAKLAFRQSSNAKLFLNPSDEELEEAKAAEAEGAPEAAGKAGKESAEKAGKESAEKTGKDAAGKAGMVPHEEALEEATEAAEASQVKAQEEYRKTGILLHELMANIESVDDVEAKISEAQREGRLPQSMTLGQVKALITKRLSHPTARQWFDGSWQLYRECALIVRRDGHTVTRRPDRVMTRGSVADGTDETIVVDFKFGKYVTEHRDQVEEYKELLKAQGRHNVKGYLWYLYKGSIEPV